MMEIFLNIMQAINDSRFWLGPILVICIFVFLALLIINSVQEEIEEFRK